MNGHSTKSLWLDNGANDCEGVGLFASPASSPFTPRVKPSKGSGGVNLDLGQLNPHFVCVLCFGYFIDATTITECMHTFCKSCIVTFLRTNRHCPHCDMLLPKTRPLASLRCDPVLQALVYKTVPGLFQTEMRRRIKFYQKHPEAVGCEEYNRDVQEFQQYVFSPDDSVSLAIRHYSSKPETSGGGSTCASPSNSTEDAMVRYFRCPSTVPVSVLKQLVKSKYHVPEALRVELLHGDNRLLDTWTLMEIAYIYTWTRESPMELSFQVIATRKVKKRRLRTVSVLSNIEHDKSKDFSFHSDLPPPEPPSSDESKEPPEKIPKMESSVNEESGARMDRKVFYRYGNHLTTPMSPEDQHGRPPTPPETPESPHILLPTKCESMDESDDSRSRGVPIDPNMITPSDDMFEEDDETLMGDQEDSEAPLEVDTSHETEPEMEIDLDHQQETKRSKSKRTRIEHRGFSKSPSPVKKQIKIEKIEQNSVDMIQTKSDSEQQLENKKQRRFRRNVVVQATKDVSCAFSDSDNESTDYNGALDLSEHARNVREARSKEGSDISRCQGSQTILSVTQSKTPKKKNKLQSQDNQSDGSNWQEGSAATQAAAFALLQLAFVQAKANGQTKKSTKPIDYSKDRESSNSLSIVHGTGDSLTIRPVTTEDGKESSSHSAKNLKNSHKSSSKHNDKHTGNTLTIKRAGKDGSLKSKLNKSPSHKSPSYCSFKDRRSKSIEKECYERTGDPIFKITNQKLSECFRLQMSNKLKQANSSTSTKSTSSNTTKESSKSECISKPKITINSEQPKQATHCHIKVPSIISSNKSSEKLNSIQNTNGTSQNKNSQPTTNSSIKIKTNGTSNPGNSTNVTKNMKSDTKTETFVPKPTNSTSKPIIKSSNASKSVAQSPSKTQLKPQIKSNCNQNNLKSANSLSSSSSLMNKNSAKSNQLTTSALKHSISSITNGSASMSKALSSIKSMDSITENKSSNSFRTNGNVQISKANSETKNKMITPMSTKAVTFEIKSSVANKVTNSLTVTKATVNPVTITPITTKKSLIIPKAALSSASNSETSKQIMSSKVNGSVNKPNESKLINGKTNGYTTTTSLDNSDRLALQSHLTKNAITLTPVSSRESDKKAAISTAAASNGTLSPVFSTANLTSFATNARSIHAPILNRSFFNIHTDSLTSVYNKISSSLNTSTNSRPTNSSVRHIPNPSLLHQQSENRISAGASTFGGAKLNGVLSRLTGGSSSGGSGGLSRIESLTRTLHEKAAGAAAAINTAAR